jgi:hypothetical protein
MAELISDEVSDRLELVLEPEAACVACCAAEHLELQVGDTFMVLDCGGGTVDITMHRVAERPPNLQLEEICPPSGGPWGSTFVDDGFERFVERLVGPAAFGPAAFPAWWERVLQAAAAEAAAPPCALSSPAACGGGGRRRLGPGQVLSAVAELYAEKLAADRVDLAEGNAGQGLPALLHGHCLRREGGAREARAACVALVAGLLAALHLAPAPGHPSHAAAAGEDGPAGLGGPGGAAARFVTVGGEAPLAAAGGEVDRGGGDVGRRRLTLFARFLGLQVPPCWPALPTPIAP